MLGVDDRNQKSAKQPQRRGLEALTPLEIVSPKSPGLDDPGWREEMVGEWESDWSEI